MPLYVTGWQREAETLDVMMMEGVEFAKGWRNLPRSLRFEIQSEERMQVYSAKVKFAARFTGLRYALILQALMCSRFTDGWLVGLCTTGESCRFWPLAQCSGECL